MQMLDPFQTVLAENFKRDDLEGAKHWIRQWHLGLVPVTIPELWEMTVRAMCGHVSDYLEGFTGEEPESYNKRGGTYLATKYGAVLWEAAYGFDQKDEHGQSADTQQRANACGTQSATTGEE